MDYFQFSAFSSPDLGSTRSIINGPQQQHLPDLDSSLSTASKKSPSNSPLRHHTLFPNSSFTANRASSVPFNLNLIHSNSNSQFLNPLHLNTMLHTNTPQFPNSLPMTTCSSTPTAMTTSFRPLDSFLSSPSCNTHHPHVPTAPAVDATLSPNRHALSHPNLLNNGFRIGPPLPIQYCAPKDLNINSHQLLPALSSCSSSPIHAAPTSSFYTPIPHLAYQPSSSSLGMDSMFLSLSSDPVTSTSTSSLTQYVDDHHVSNSQQQVPASSSHHAHQDTASYNPEFDTHEQTRAKNRSKSARIDSKRQRLIVDSLGLVVHQLQNHSPKLDPPAPATTKPVKRSNRSLNKPPAPSALDDEEYAKLARPDLSPRAKRQLRNKLSAKNFRIRKKAYLASLESRVRCLEEFIMEYANYVTHCGMPALPIPNEIFDGWNMHAESQQQSGDQPSSSSFWGTSSPTTTAANSSGHGAYLTPIHQFQPTGDLPVPTSQHPPDCFSVQQHRPVCDSALSLLPYRTPELVEDEGDDKLPQFLQATAASSPPLLDPPRRSLRSVKAPVSASR